VNHFKSKRGGALETEHRRIAQAEHVLALARAVVETDPEAAILVAGDFNDYELSPTIAALTQGGLLQSLLAGLPAASRYSYVFGGVAQLIDGLYASPSLGQQLQSAAIQHVNADFPASLALDTTPGGIAFRSSDHDLPVARLRWPLRADSDQVTGASALLQRPTVASPARISPTPVVAADAPVEEPTKLPWQLGLVPVLVLGLVAIWRGIARRRGVSRQVE
jgi:hypothetical protein